MTESNELLSSLDIVFETIEKIQQWIWRQYVIVSYELYAHFGSPGSMNNINVINSSRTLKNIIASDFSSSFSTVLNGKRRDMPHYLASGTRPS